MPILLSQLSLLHYNFEINQINTLKWRINHFQRRLVINLLSKLNWTAMILSGFKALSMGKWKLRILKVRILTKIHSFLFLNRSIKNHKRSILPNTKILASHPITTKLFKKTCANLGLKDKPPSKSIQRNLWDQTKDVSKIVHRQTFYLRNVAFPLIRARKRVKISQI